MARSGSIPGMGMILAAAIALSAVGCGRAPALAYPWGTFIAVEWDEFVADRDGDRPLTLPRINDPGRIETFVDALNQNAVACEPFREKATGSLHFVRNGKPRVDVGLIPSVDGSDRMGLYVDERFFQAPRGPIVEALNRLGFDGTRWSGAAQ